MAKVSVRVTAGDSDEDMIMPQSQAPSTQRDWTQVVSDAEALLRTGAARTLRIDPGIPEDVPAANFPRALAGARRSLVKALDHGIEMSDGSKASDNFDIGYLQGRLIGLRLKK